jgi:hypothetical protein
MELASIHKILDPAFDPNYLIKRGPIEMPQMMEGIGKRYLPLLGLAGKATLGTPGERLTAPIAAGKHIGHMAEEAPIQTLFDMLIGTGLAVKASTPKSREIPLMPKAKPTAKAKPAGQPLKPILEEVLDFEKPKAQEAVLPKVEVAKPAPAVGAKEIPLMPKKKAPVAETPKETAVETKVVGLKKAEIERIREQTELDQLPEVERKTFEESLGKAKESKLDESALDIADEVIKNKRPVTDEEFSGMSLKAAKIADEYDIATKQASELIDKGDVAAANIERVRAESLLDQLDKLTEASDLGGRETARALSIRRMMVNRETYDLAHVMQKAQAAKGSKLTPKETARIEKIVGNYKKLKDQYNDVLAEYEKTLAELDKKQADQVINKRRTITTKSARAKKKLADERANIKKQLAEMGIRVNDITGLSAEGMHVVGKLGINYIKQGARTLEEVVRLVRADVPDLTPRDIYRALISKDPALQAKAKATASKQIAQIKRQAKLLVDIENAERGIFEPGKKKPAQRPEIRRLQRKLRDLRAEAYKSNLDNRRLEKSIRTINELQDQLENHYRRIKSKQKPDPAEIQSAKEKIKQLRQTMRTTDELANLNEQLRTGDFVIKERPKPKELPPDMERKRVELEMARKKVKNAIRDMAPLGVRGTVGEIANFNRAALATADMSGWFRQNVIPAFSHPIKTAKLAPRITKSFFSNFQAEKIDAQLRDSPTRYLKDRAKLVFRELDGIPQTREESFMSRFIEKVPGVKIIVKASNRNMTSMGNLIRDSLFDDFLRKYPNATAAELKAYANILNVTTGIGDLGRFASVANELSFGFFAPKLAVSRFQTPYMIAKHWKLPRVRKQAIRDIGGFVATGTTIITLAKLAGLETSDDPMSADWGKIKSGNMRVDIWGGFQQPARFVAATGMGLYEKIATGETDYDPVEAFGRMASYKMSPFIGMGRALYTGKTAVGEEVNVPQAMANSLIPLIIQDIRDTYKLEGLGKAATAGGLAFIGVGVNTYEDSEMAIRRKIRKLKDKDNLIGAMQLQLEWNIEHPDRQIKVVRTTKELKMQEELNEYQKIN